MKSKDVKINKERIAFSKRIKRKVLLEIAKGKKPQEALLKYLPVAIEEITKDSKYASKLIYKWKKEVYANREMLFLLNHDLDNEMLNEEIETMGKDDEQMDFIIDFEEIKKEFLKTIE